VTSGGSQDMACMMVVTGKKGAVVRRDAELDSERIADVPKGTICYAMEQRESSDGKARVRLCFPEVGWASAKVLGRHACYRDGRGEPESVGGYGFVDGEACEVSEARWAAEVACANVGGFVGVLPRSDYAFHAHAGDNRWERHYLGEDAGREAGDRWCCGLSPRLKPEARNGHVALPEPRSGGHPASDALGALGECGDTGCCCYRPRKPFARRSFRAVRNPTTGFGVPQELFEILYRRQIELVSPSSRRLERELSKIRSGTLTLKVS